MTTYDTTSEQALKILNKNKNPLIVRARYEAVQLCQEKGHTYSREVRDTMEIKGLLPDLNDDRWLGAVFTGCDFFEPTGGTIAVKDEGRNIHAGRDAKLWKLKEAYGKITLPDPGALPHIESKVRIGRMDQLVREAQMRIGGQALIINVKPLTTVNDRESDPSLVTIHYARFYGDHKGPMRVASGETLEQALERVITLEDELDRQEQHA